MRIDKFLTGAGIASRTEAAKAARAGEITVDGEIVRRADLHIDPEKNVITFRGECITFRKNTYVMLNKPAGYVSSTDDPRDKTVLTLLDDRLQRIGLFPCGRLDKDTVGLMILTDNGPLAHRLLAPKSHVAKKYYYRCALPLAEEDAEKLRGGVSLGDFVSAPCEIENGGTEGIITLFEGKYHEIKRMFEKVGNKIVFLERRTFGDIPLDTSLERGEWRLLTDDEIALLEGHMKK